MALPEKIREAWSELAELMIEDMQRDGLAWMRSWNAPVPVNGVTGEPYHGRNAMLLMAAMRSHGFDDPRFMTFQTARRGGYSVRKGEHSVAAIEKWAPYVYDTLDPGRKVKQPTTPEEWRRVEEDPDLGVRYTCVGYYNLFNATQVDGIAAYEAQGARLSTLEAANIDLLEALAPCPVREVRQNSAYFDRRADEIVLPKRDQFVSFSAMARVLLHEESHASGSSLRLARKFGERFGDDDYAREELVAELSALFCANTLGIDVTGEPGPLGESAYWENHASYLKSWSKRFDNPSAEIRLAVGKAAAAADYVLAPFVQRNILGTWRDAALEDERRAPHRMGAPALVAESPQALASTAVAIAAGTSSTETHSHARRL